MLLDLNLEINIKLWIVYNILWVERYYLLLQTDIFWMVIFGSKNKFFGKKSIIFWMEQQFSSDLVNSVQ